MNRLKLVIHGVTDVGMNREHNEDSIGWDTGLGLVLLADGMGGHNAGEIASELAVTTIREALHDVLLPELVEANVINFADAVREAVVYANEEIHLQAHQRIECAGMGTTLVMALFHDKKITYAHVGDSRIYRFRNGEVEQITSDHSLVQEMVDNGYLSEEEAMLSTNRNLITRALGIAPDVEVDVVTNDLEQDDVYLLCSDGLSDLVDEEDMQATLLQHQKGLHAAAQTLVDLANARGGTDNISVILVALNEAYSDDHGIAPGESQEVPLEEQADKTIVNKTDKKDIT